MKKIISVVLCLTFALLLAGCTSEGAKGNENVPNVPESRGETGNEEPANKEAAAEQHAGLSAEDLEQIAAILEAGQWNTEGTSDCLSDYTLEWNGRKLSYHSDCGTFNGPGVGENGRSLCLTEEEKQTVNGIMEKLDLSSNVDRAECQEPPVLSVICGEREVQATKSTYCWNYCKSGDQWIGVCADSMHPLECKEYMTPLVLSAGENSLWAQMQFDAVPDEIRVQCWSEEYWEQNDVEGESVEVMTLRNDHSGDESIHLSYIELKDGNYVYEVYASWDSYEKFEGSCYYAFYTLKA